MNHAVCYSILKCLKFSLSYYAKFILILSEFIKFIVYLGNGQNEDHYDEGYWDSYDEFPDYNEDYYDYSYE